MILLGCQGRPLGCPEEDQMNWKLWSSHAIFRTGLTVLSSIRVTLWACSIRVTLWACSLVFFFGGLHKPQRSDLSRCVRRSNGVHESRGSQAYIFVNNVPPCCTRDDQQLWFILILASSVEFTLVECYGVVRGRPSVKMWLARNVTFFVTNMWRTSRWRFLWRTCDGRHCDVLCDGHVTDVMCDVTVTDMWQTLVLYIIWVLDLGTIFLHWVFSLLVMVFSAAGLHSGSIPRWGVLSCFWVRAGSSRQSDDDALHCYHQHSSLNLVVAIIILISND